MFLAYQWEIYLFIGKITIGDSRSEKLLE